MSILATARERKLAELLCEVGGMQPSQAPGLALIIASYRDELLSPFGDVLEHLAAEAEKSGPGEGAAYYICIDTLKGALSAVRGER